jgi:hypothetical protein
VRVRGRVAGVLLLVLLLIFLVAGGDEAATVVLSALEGLVGSGLSFIILHSLFERVGLPCACVVRCRNSVEYGATQVRISAKLTTTNERLESAPQGSVCLSIPS